LWAHATGEASLLVLAKIKLSPEDIIKMSLYARSQILYLSLLLVFIQALQGKQKTLLTRGKQGWKKSISFVTCLP
jgi:hypothetical protein